MSGRGWYAEKKRKLAKYLVEDATRLQTAELGLEYRTRHKPLPYKDGWVSRTMQDNELTADEQWARNELIRTGIVSAEEFESMRWDSVEILATRRKR